MRRVLIEMGARRVLLPAMGLVVCCGLLAVRSIAEDAADDESALVATVRQGLRAREDLLDSTSLWVSVLSHATRNEDYEAWRAQQLSAHFGRPYEAAEEETSFGYELRRTAESLYYSEFVGLGPEGRGEVEPYLEYAVTEGHYVRVQRAGGTEARALVNVGLVEAYDWEPPLPGFLLMTYGTTPWSEFVEEVGWHWLGIEQSGGEPCYVIATAGSLPLASQAVWVDPAHGFSVRRHVSRYPNNEIQSEAFVEAFTQGPEGLWLPTRVVRNRYSSSSEQELDGGSYGKHVLTVNVVNRAVYHDPSTLTDERLSIRLPEGALVYDTATEQWETRENGDDDGEADTGATVGEAQETDEDLGNPP